MNKAPERVVGRAKQTLGRPSSTMWRIATYGVSGVDNDSVEALESGIRILTTRSSEVLERSAIYAVTPFEDAAPREQALIWPAVFALEEALDALDERLDQAAQEDQG